VCVVEENKQTRVRKKKPSKTKVVYMLLHPSILGSMFQLLPRNPLFITFHLNVVRSLIDTIYIDFL
jgi:hypothetical protein